MQRRIIAKAECDLVADYVRRKGMSITAMELVRFVSSFNATMILLSVGRGQVGFVTLPAGLPFRVFSRNYR